MSRTPRVVKSVSDVVDSNSRPVLVPTGNKKLEPSQKLSRKVKKEEEEVCVKEPREEMESQKTHIVLSRQEVLRRSNFSPNAPSSSECSSDTSRSGVSDERNLNPKKSTIRPEKVAVTTGVSNLFRGRRCHWVTPNTDPCYSAFHDEEWGVPVHSDRKLFELLVLSSALAELTWPVILSKRHIFREVFMEFDPVAVSKLNDKQVTTKESVPRTLVSESKLRAIIDNAHQILKVIEEFGSFDKYCWNFVNNKPVVSKFRYPRQIPVRTSKAEIISKDMLKRGFRCVGPTVVYSFMQSAGLTNDHLISCYRFGECCRLDAVPAKANRDDTNSTKGDYQYARRKTYLSHEQGLWNRMSTSM